MERFPTDEFARGIYAETLRDLGRYEEAQAHLKLTMEQFPTNEVVPNIYAETLRDLGRYEEALAHLNATMEQFPTNEVIPTIYAETLRDLGRYEEAQAHLKLTMEQFPRNEIVQRNYAETLRDLGRYDEAIAILAAQAERKERPGDWIAAHILAMTHLKIGNIPAAMAILEDGKETCPFRAHQTYFARALPLALLAAKRPAEAVHLLETIGSQSALPRASLTNVVLLKAHALAELDQRPRARELLVQAQIIDFATAKAKRLANALKERYALSDAPPPSPDRVAELSHEIHHLELELASPPIKHDFKSSRSYARLAA